MGVQENPNLAPALAPNPDSNPNEVHGIRTARLPRDPDNQLNRRSYEKTSPQPDSPNNLRRTALVIGVSKSGHRAHPALLKSSTSLRFFVLPGLKRVSDETDSAHDQQN